MRFPPRVPGWPPPLLALFLGACEGGSLPDVPLVDDLPNLTVAEDLRIGSVDDPDRGFSRIDGVEVGPDGRIYVLDGQDQQIRVFDDTGRPLRAIGRRGDGPGEFTRALFFGFKDDTLWVNDAGQMRVTLMSAEGQVFSTFPVGSEMVSSPPGPMVMARAGVLRADGLLDSYPLVAVAAGADLPDSVAVPELVFDRHGGVVDTAGYGPLPFAPFRTITLGGRQVFVPGAPSDQALTVAMPDGKVVVDRRAPATGPEAVFTVTRIRTPADTVYRRVLRYRPRGFTPAFVDSLVARSLGAAVRASALDSAAAERALRDALELPAFQTPVSEGHAGEDGSLWLRREDDGGPVFEWIVLQADGTPRGRFELPRSAAVHWAEGGTVYAAVADDLGVPWVVRYRIGG